MTEFKSSQQPKCGIVTPDPRDGATRAQNDKHLVMTTALKSSLKSSSCLVSISVLELNDLKTFRQREERKAKGSVSKQRRYKSLVSEKSLMKPQWFKGN